MFFAAMIVGLGIQGINWCVEHSENKRNRQRAKYLLSNGRSQCRRQSNSINDRDTPMYFY
jgi:hypothetical protein